MFIEYSKEVSIMLMFFVFVMVCIFIYLVSIKIFNNDKPIKPNKTDYEVDWEKARSNRHICIKRDVKREWVEQSVVSRFQEKANSEFKKSIDFNKLKYVLTRMDFLDLLSLEHNMKHFWEFYSFDKLLVAVSINEFPKYKDI